MKIFLVIALLSIGLMIGLAALYLSLRFIKFDKDEFQVSLEHSTQLLLGDSFHYPAVPTIVRIFFKTMFIVISLGFTIGCAVSIVMILFLLSRSR
jgi:hypothetical protein